MHDDHNDCDSNGIPRPSEVGAPFATKVPDHRPGSGLADTGARVSSVTGSLREPKPVTDGRYDLIPAECVTWMLAYEKIPSGFTALSQALWLALELKGDEAVAALAFFAGGITGHLGGFSPLLHRLAVHYARGAVKYADRNWELGQQTGWVVSSLCRHFKKLIAGDTDEDHGAAVLWNVFTLMHHIPRIADGRLRRELDDYGFCKAGAA